MNIRAILLALAMMVTVTLLLPSPGLAQEAPLPYYLRDRGSGIPMSIFGTYVREGELLIYPFYEYYHDHNFEYEPFDFGRSSTRELRGRYRAHEGLIFFGYGISDWLAVEFEAGVITATLDTAIDDTSGLPPRIEASGVSDVETQARWRWNRESVDTPEVFSYFETVFPTGNANSLIGTSEWELKFGTGVVKGFEWGTMTVRAAFEYVPERQKVESGEYAVEYLKRLSDRFRFFAMLEGSEDELSVIPEIQWHFHDRVFLKASGGIGATPKATDFAPEVGVVFSLFQP